MKRHVTEREMRAVLTALERGAVSSAEAIRVALRGERRFAEWIEASRRLWNRSPLRRASIHRPQTLVAEVAAAALRIARKRYASSPGVASIHWGLVRREGRSTEEPGIVIVMDRKPKSRWIVRPLKIRRGRSVYSVSVDRQVVSAPGTLQAGVRPGNHATVEVDGVIGSLSAVLDSKDGLRAVVSGHVAQREGLPAVARTVSGDEVSIGKVERVLLGRPVDAARAGPVSAKDAARIAVSAPVDLYDITCDDLNTAVWVQTARELTPQKVFVTAVGQRAKFAYRVDGKTVERYVDDLIATSHDATEAGDSGAPVVDLHGRLVGFVIGIYNGRTFLVPARRALENLDS